MLPFAVRNRTRRRARIDMNRPFSPALYTMRSVVEESVLLPKCAAFFRVSRGFLTKPGGVFTGSSFRAQTGWLWAAIMVLDLLGLL